MVPIPLRVRMAKARSFGRCAADHRRNLGEEILKWHIRPAGRGSKVPLRTVPADANSNG
jgi:hypothetical protein